MNTDSVVRINSDKASHYSLSSFGTGHYDYSMSWFYAHHKEPLPVISRFVVTKNMSLHTEQMLHDQYIQQSDCKQKNLFPLSVRYIDTSGNYYVERPPFKVKINYKNARAAYKGVVVDDLEIWIPWTLMVIPQSFSRTFDPNSVCIFYSSEPLKSTKSRYMHSLLPNSYESGAVCWSQSFQKLISTDNTRDNLHSFDLTYWHSMILNDYMMGGWNNDLQSSSLNCITPYFDSRQTNYADILRLEKDMNPQEAEQYICKKYPNLYRYMHMEKFPELSQKVFSVLINKFKLNKDVCSMLTDLSYVPSGRRRRINYDDNVGYTYSKFLAFLSVISLSETLDFYSDVSLYLSEYSKNTSYSRYTHSFSKILSEYNKNFNQEGYSSYPILLPFTSLTKNNIDLLSSSTAFYKVMKIYYLVEGLNQLDMENYCDKRRIPYRDIFDIFKVRPESFFDLVDDFSTKSTEDTLYIKIDMNTRSLSVVDKQYFVQAISNLSLIIKEKLEESKTKKKKKRDSYYFSRFEYIDTEEKILNALSISNE